MAAADAREILIAGGGIGGLAAALALEGRAVRVLEDAASYPARLRPWAIAVAAFFMTGANSSSCAARTDGRTTPMLATTSPRAFTGTERPWTFADSSS